MAILNAITMPSVIHTGRLTDRKELDTPECSDLLEVSRTTIKPLARFPDQVVYDGNRSRTSGIPSAFNHLTHQYR